MGLYKFYYWDRYKRKILRFVSKNNYDLISNELKQTESEAAKASIQKLKQKQQVSC